MSLIKIRKLLGKIEHLVDQEIALGNSSSKNEVKKTSSNLKHASQGQLMIELALENGI